MAMSRSAFDDQLPLPRHGHTSLEGFMREALQARNILSPEHRRRFMALFARFVWQRENPRDWHAMLPVPEGLVLPYADVSRCPESPELRQTMLDKVAVLKLNGGLGSTMGCRYPKSAIPVRQDLSFLDLIVRQVEFLNNLHSVDIPLILMNSFKTHEITTKLLRRFLAHNITIHTFQQNCYPRVAKETLAPLPSAPFKKSRVSEFYPPGHGDVYESLFASGLLDNLIANGKEYLFVSNVDNLGATLDLDLLYHVYDQDIDFAVEVTERSRTDIEGGVLVGEADGDTVQPVLVEMIEVPSSLKDEFRHKFNLFNTNNIWVNLRKLQQCVATGALNDDVVVHERLVEGIRTLQLETLAGSAIRHFQNRVAVNVDRTRYLPVKSTSDLFLAQSNLFDVQHGALVMSAERRPPILPVVKLGLEFQLVDDYIRRFPHGLPNIVDLEHLTVAGHVIFGADVTLKGSVIIVANEGSVIMIPDGTTLEDKVVTGNLRILDH